MTQSPFDMPTPAVGGGETYPANFQLVGRLVLFWVAGFTPNVKSSFTRTVTGPDGRPTEEPVYQDQIVAHTAVLDGEPMTGKLDYATRQVKEPFPFPFTAPIEFEGMLWSQDQMVKTLRPGLTTGRPILGRLIYGTKRGTNSPPMKLDKPTEQDQQLALRYLAQRDQIKAYWEQKFTAAGLGPVQANPQGGPFDFGIATYGQAPVPQTQALPQYQPPAPAQDQPWNPYNGQQAAPPAQANGWDTQRQGPALQAAAAQPSATPPNWNQSSPAQSQNPAPWTPTPDGPPAGWPGSQQ